MNLSPKELIDSAKNRVLDGAKMTDPLREIVAIVQAAYPDLSEEEIIEELLRNFIVTSRKQ